MSRSRAFFHGTNVDLEPGDMVLPRSVSGAPAANYDPHQGTEMASEKWAAATSREHVAWDFADRAAHFASRGYGRMMGAAEPLPPPAGGGRARVYRVEPVGAHQIGVENRRHPDYQGVDSAEHIAPAWRVVDRIDIHPPPSRAWFLGAREHGPGAGQARWVPNKRGQQGTLPVDFSSPGAGNSHVNHPTGHQHGGTVTPEEAGVTLKPVKSPVMRGQQFEGQLELPIRKGQRRGQV